MGNADHPLHRHDAQQQAQDATDEIATAKAYAEAAAGLGRVLFISLYEYVEQQAEASPHECVNGLSYKAQLEILKDELVRRAMGKPTLP